MPDLKTYDPNEVSVIFADRSIDSGRVDGDFVTSEYTSELYTMKTGADGEVVRVKSADQSAKITLKLMSTSSGHRILTQLYQAARASTNGDDIAPIQIRDRLGGLVEHADKAWISKAPSNAFGKDVGERDWEIMVSQLERTVE